MKLLNKIYNNLKKYDINDDIAAYALYSNQSGINNDVIISLLRGYDFNNDKWVNDNARQFCINHLKNYCKKTGIGYQCHNNILILEELKTIYPQDF